MAPGCQERVAVVGLVQAGHDPQDARLTGPVGTDDADLRARKEVQRDVVKDDLVAVRLADLPHRVDEFGHAVDVPFSIPGSISGIIAIRVVGPHPRRGRKSRVRRYAVSGSPVLGSATASGSHRPRCRLSGSASAATVSGESSACAASAASAVAPACRCGRCSAPGPAPPRWPASPATTAVAVPVLVLTGVDVADDDHRVALAERRRRPR